MNTKSLASLKRRIKVGTRLRCVCNTYNPKYNGTMRTVVKALTVGFRWMQDGEQLSGMTHYPKANDFTWIDADTFRFGLNTKDKGHYVEMRFEDERKTVEGQP